MKNICNLLFLLTFSLPNTFSLSGMDKQPPALMPRRNINFGFLIFDLKELSFEDLQERFKQLPSQESCEKMVYRLISAKMHKKNLDHLKCVEFLENITEWVNGWDYSTTKTLLFSQDYLQYVLPVLEKVLNTPITGLNLSSNNLERLPDSIGQLGKLRWLWLCGNNLKNLPESLNRLIDLQVLWVDEGVEIPKVLEALEDSKRLKVDRS